MRVVIGSDHAGVALKEHLGRLLTSLGYEVMDIGTESSEPVDYPDIAEKLSRTLKENRADRGVLICGSGVGASIAANKIPGIRAAACHDTYTARQGVEHDDMNVLVLGSRVLGVESAKDVVLSFLAARFSRLERHVRRLRKVEALEQKYRT